MATDSLTVSESATLGRLEQVISKGIQSFVEVGNALLQIRDHKLYRLRHKTFESYCQEKWGIGRRQANNLISAVEVVGDLGSAIPKSSPVTPPTSVRQVSPLARLPKEERREAWQEIVETAPNSKPTGKHAEKVVDRRLADKRPPAPKTEPRRPVVTTIIEDIVEGLENFIRLIEQETASSRTQNNHSRMVLATLQKAIGEVKAMEESWRRGK